MDKVVDKNGVHTVSTLHQINEGFVHLEAFVHHTLTPEQQSALVSLMERMIVAAVEGFARV